MGKEKGALFMKDRREFEEKTILLVEDDEQDIELFERAFREAGIRSLLRKVRSAQEAMAYLRREPPYQLESANPFPSLVLLDLRLPGMSGFEFLKWLKEETLLSKLTVMTVSVSQQKADMLKAYELGASSCLPKSHDFKEIIEVLKQAIGSGE